MNSSWKHETEGENKDNVHVSKKNSEGVGVGRRDREHIPQVPSSKDFP